MIRLGEAPLPGVSYRDRPGAYALIVRGDRALLTLEHSKFGLEIALPGGGVDPGETPLRALHREVMEETGWRIAPLRRLGAYQRYCYLPEYAFYARKICHIYLAQPTQRLGDPIEPHHDAVWVPADLVPDMVTSPADGPFLAPQVQQIARTRPRG